MKNQKQDPIHIKSVIQNVLKTYSHSKGADLFQISDIWESVVGTVIANDARPWRMYGKKLEVHVSGSVWLHQLNYMKNDMIQKLNDRMGDKVIESIHFKIGNF
ncbi:MAG: DUF721 domain-containing protein [Candidatus Magnetomorum sp.]|nr:DUF721 domain-containing protein [Candidatus Magnetomorum sp.]